MISKRNLIALSIFSLFSISTVSASSLESLNLNVEKKEESVVDYSNLDFSVIDIDTEENALLIAEDEKTSELRNVIESLDSEFKNAEIKPLKEIEGLYEVSNEKTTLYITEDGKYIIPMISKVVGNSFENIQKQKKEEKISKRLKEIPEENMVKYTANKSVPFKAKIYVFSDFTCPYCKRMHKEVLNINNLGIEVNYIPYPRNGTIDKPALLGLQKIMCSTSPTLEFDQAFLDPREYVKGINAINSSCISGKRALHESLTMGDEFSVTGTPYIFTEDGAFLGGWNGINTFIQKLNLELSKEALEK